MSPLLLLAALFLYLGFLFLVALWGEGRGKALAHSPWTYALSLGVYATAWTFFGSVGWAASQGATFLPIYLGPTLALALWPWIYLKLLRLARTYRLTSWADLLSVRYGRDPRIGALVAAFLVVGLLPYLALQLKAIAQAFLFLSAEQGPLADVALYTALLLSFFAVLFGTRRLDPTERHEGLVLAVAFESLVKLFALLLLGGLVLVQAGPGLFQKAAELPALVDLLLPPQGLEGQLAWLSLTFLALLAFLFLPRQFHVAVVENVAESHLKRAAWAFPLYLLLLNLPVLLLALLGQFHYPTTPPDLYVLALASEQGRALALLVFLGGVSAATAMVIVESLALSILVSNHLLSPLLLRTRALGSLLAWRRLSIVGVMLLAYLYFRLAGEAYALVAMGLISFVAVAQLAPAGLLGLFWVRSTRAGAVAGLVGGIAVWSYSLFLPALARSGWLPEVFLTGPHPLLNPEGLFGLAGLDAISHGFLASMVVNLGLHLLVSLMTRPQPAEAVEARAFTEEVPSAGRLGELGALAALVERFLGAEGKEALEAYARTLRGEAKGGVELVAHAEALLAGSLGPATARLLILSVTQEAPLAAVEEAARESQAVRSYARALEEARRELAEAYEQLKELDRLKDEFLAVVSHELKTPLTAIRAIVEILEANPQLERDERERFTHILSQESKRLSRLVEEILAYARLEAATSLAKAPVELKALAEEALALSAPLARERGVALEAKLCEVRLNTDRDRVLQVLLNLLANALRHARSRVSLELEVLADALLFRVADDGPGVPEALRGRLFEPFQSFSGGSGLGLAITRKLVERLGGRIWVEGGPGGVFAFTLPVEGDDGRTGRTDRG
jgi:Na+/proline symporter/nitrogen-specific signal transduction histidine kinase